MTDEDPLRDSSECTGWCAPRVLDTADIVRDAIFHQLIFFLPAVID